MTKPFQYTKSFQAERCDYCGRCLEECPELAMDSAQAKKEIRALVETGDSDVLRRCTGCMACNSLCPTDANPHTLILSRWRERYEAEGIPSRGKLVLPHQRPNLYTIMMEHLPEDEKALVATWRRNWEKPSGADTMLYTGCNSLLQPFLLDSRLFSDLPIFGAPELCCGEPLYRMGCWEPMTQLAQTLRDEFKRMGLRRIIMPCLAGFHLFRDVYPKIFDVSLDCEIVSIFEWLGERLEEEDVSVAPLGKKAVLHDSCWGKAEGDQHFEEARALLAELGIEVVEPAHTRESALCCGMCAPAAQFSLRDALRTAKGRIAEFEASGADMVVDYCGGCNWLMTLAGRFMLPRPKLPIYHLLEVVQMAIGEPLKHRTQERVRAVMRNISLPLLRGYLTPGHFRVETRQ